MAQHDYIVSNQSGAAFRSDLNNALAAIVSNNSGAVEPSTTYAYQFWADTTAGVLKQRNAANSAWITLFQLDGEWTTIALENGTAAAPSLYFKDSGTDTGIYSAGTDQVAVATAGVQRVNFNGSTEVVFNDTGADVDFRIEGDTDPNLFVIDAGTDQVRVKNLNGGPLAGFRNAIINGNFDIWQRGTSFTSNDYGADRWFNNRNVSTCTMSRQAFTLGQTDVPGEPTYFCRMAVTSVAGAGNYVTLQHRVESVRTFAGQQVTLSFWAKADAAKPIAVELAQNFGTGGSPSSTVTAIGVTKTTLSTSWQKVTVTATLPSISGKTLGSAGNDWLNLNIWLEAGSDFNARTNNLGQQSGTFDIAQVQLEAGTVATPFERRSYGQELALCQRYYETGESALYMATTNGGQYSNFVAYKVTKRTFPTVTLTSTNNSAFPTTATVQNNSVGAFAEYRIANATALNGGFSSNWTASAEL